MSKRSEEYLLISSIVKPPGLKKSPLLKKKKAVMEFWKRKSMAMAAMVSESPTDKSPKGSLDKPIIPLLDAINAHPSYFTTSSCSGRISILPQLSHNKNNTTKKKNKAGTWVFITHESADAEEVVNLLFGGGVEFGGCLVFRFEPFILAVDCADVEAAQTLVSTAISSGFRESGITNISKRIMVAIRSSIRLEVPLGDMEKIKVSPEYVRCLVGIANEKMDANKRRTDRFLHDFLSKDSNRKFAYQNGGTVKGDSVVGSQSDDIKQTSIAPRTKSNHCEDISPYPVQVLDSQEDCGLHSCQTEPISESDISASGYDLLPKQFNSRPQQATSTHDSNASQSNRSTLLAINMEISGEPMERLFLWGHSATTVEDSGKKKVLIFGGFGGSGRHSRQNELLMLDAESGLLEIIHTTGAPSPRLGHTSAVVGDQLFVIGGRGDPTQIFDDVWVLHMTEKRWELVQCGGALLSPRHRQAATVIGSKIYVFGGLNSGIISASLHVLDTDTLEWTELTSSGEWPCARHSHSLVSAGSELLMFGGYDGEKTLGDLYSFDTKTHTWKEVKTTRRSPCAKFSHLMFVYGKYLGVLGGCSIVQDYQEMSLLDLQNGMWEHVTIRSAQDLMLVRSTVSIVNDDLIIIGGGAACYAFGTKFNEPLRFNCSKLTSDRSGYPPVGASASQSGDTQKSNCVLEGFSVANLSKSDEYECTEVITENSEQIRAFGDGGRDIYTYKKIWVLSVERKHGKFAKDILKRNRWLDLERKVTKSDDELHLFIPITRKCYECLAQKMLYSQTPLDGVNGRLSAVPYINKGNSLNEAFVPEPMDLLVACGASLLEDKMSSPKKGHKAPHQILREVVCSIIEQQGLPTELLEEVPNGKNLET